MVRRVAVVTLGGIGPRAKEAIPALIAALKDDDPGVRQTAAGALGGIGPEAKEAIPALIAALKDGDPGVRRTAAEALEGIGPAAKEAIPALIAALKDGDPWVRRTAAEALGAIGPAAKEAIPALITALKDDDPWVRRMAAVALGEIGPAAKEAIPALITALKGDKNQIQEVVADSLASIAENLVDSGDIVAIASLKQALDVIRKSANANQAEASRRISRSITALEAMERSRWINQLLERAADNKWVTGAAALALVYLLWFLALRFVVLPKWPLSVLAWNETLKPYVDFELPAWLGKLKVPTRQILLIGLFHHHRHVLNAWVDRYLETVRRNFKQGETYRARENYVSIPVILDGVVIPDLTAGALQPTYNEDRWSLLISGEGGSGKTTLACQIALWAMGEKGAKPLCEDRHMLPVLIEPSLGFDVLKDIPGFKKVLRGRLQDLIGTAEPLPEDLFERLIRTRRVLVILDGLSEMVSDPSAAEQDKASPIHPDFPAAALIATSRTKDVMKGTHATIQPTRIDSEHLSRFMNAYLAKAGCPDFEDSELFRAYGRLAVMVSDGGHITPLLAKLYAEQMIASAREGKLQLDLPDTVPGLMLEYLNLLNRDKREGDPDNPSVHGVAKLAAWAFLKRSFHPGPAEKKDVLDALGNTPSAPDLLEYLEKRLRLIRTIPPKETYFQFELDPLAEYLAGMKTVQENLGNMEEWGRFLEKADAMTGAPKSIKGFLLAVRDCCLVMEEAHVPDSVPDELGKRAGLDLEYVGRIQQKRRILKLIEDLKLPYVDDRRHAADALGHIGPEARLAVPALIRAFQDDDEEVRGSAAEALFKIGPVSVSALIEKLHDEQSHVRARSAYVLGRFGDAAKASIPSLIGLLEDEHPGVRRTAANVLGGLGADAKDAVPSLCKMLQDEDGDARRFAAEALGRIGPNAKPAVPILIEAMKDEDRSVRQYAAEALGNIGPGARDAVPTLGAALRDGDIEIRRAAAESLVKLGPDATDAIPALTEMLQDGDSGARGIATEVLERIRP